jgi:hypothetical protein
MTYAVYAMFEEGSYRVATSNDHQHGLDVAERVCRDIGQWPLGFVSGPEHTLKLNCEVYDLADLQKRALTAHS